MGIGAAAYANFRSEMEELEPCVNLSDWHCDFARNGYRLPTEAEWEKAVRGGLIGQHFPWPSFGTNCAAYLRCANRALNNPANGRWNRGFRCVRRP